MASYQTGAFNLYNSAIKDFLDGTQDWDTDAHRLVLLTSAYTPDASHDTYSDISTHECSDPDYTAQDMAGETVTIVGNESVCDANDVSFGSDVDITARYAAIVVGTVAGATGTDRLVGYLLLNRNNLDVQSIGGSYDVNWNATQGVFVTRSGVSVVQITSPYVANASGLSLVPGESAGRIRVTNETEPIEDPRTVETDVIRRVIDLAYEADYGIDESDGGNVDEWEPTTWSLYDWKLEQTTAGNRPIYRATAATSGEPSVEFNGDGTTTVANQDFMDATFDSAQSQPCTVIMVMENKSVLSGGGTFFDTPNANQNQLSYESTNKVMTQYAGTTVNNYELPFVEEDDPSMFVSIFNSNASSDDEGALIIDDWKYVIPHPSTGADTMDDFRVGANTDGEYGGDFYCHAIYIAFRKLSDSEIATIRSYIQTKWDVSDVPSLPTPVVQLDENSAKWQNTGGTTAVTADGQNVRRWDNDGSLGGYFSTSGTPPTHDTTSMLVDSVDFGGSAILLMDSDHAELSPASGDSFYVFAAIQTTDTSTNVGVCGKWDGTDNEWYLIYKETTSPSGPAAGVPTYYSPSGVVSDVNDGDPHVLHFEQTDDDKIVVCLDGAPMELVPTDITAFPSDTGQVMIVGGYSDGTSSTYMTGQIARLRVYDEASDLSRKQIHRILFEMMDGLR
jgi:hypothetical protein